MKFNCTYIRENVSSERYTEWAVHFVSNFLYCPGNHIPARVTIYLPGQLYGAHRRFVDLIRVGSDDNRTYKYAVGDMVRSSVYIGMCVVYNLILRKHLARYVYGFLAFPFQRLW